MKFLIVFVALFAIAVARPNKDSKDAEIVRSTSDVEPEGFQFSYETSDGTKHDSDGKLKDVGSDHEAIVVHGSYSFVDPEGHSHTVSYVADENGYVAEGADVPKVVA